MKFGRRDSTLFASPPPAEPSALPEPTAMPGPAPAAAPQPTPRRASNELNAFLGRGCIYEGKLTFEGRVRIDGKFTGEIFSNETLEIGPDAEIEAQIDVAALVIAGRVNGDINARARCDLRAPAVVIGNITSSVITMEEGVRFDGAMRMTTALDEAVRATTKRAPSTPRLAKKKDNGASAPASRDPSDLMKS